MIKSQNLLPLTGGAYQARNAISDYEICENLFPEINPQTSDSPTPTIHYPREGERPLSAPPTAGSGRGVFTLSSGALFAMVANTLYYINPAWQWTALGTVAANLATPVSIADNGTSAVLVDGTKAGYAITLPGNAFAPIVDPTGLFVGSKRADYADTFLAFAAPGTNAWYLSLANSVTFNALVQATKDSSPDLISTFAFNIRQAWLLGTKTSEVWFLAGTTPFPYQSWPNVFVPYGCIAPYSLVRADVDLFWIASNDQGRGLAVKTKGYAVEAISTRALEYEWSTYPTVADVIGGTFQQGGHTFIIFHFPSADISWGYDLATQQWHRRASIDSNGVPHRENASFYANVGEAGGYAETIVGQDWRTGQIYALDPKYYTDNGVPIVCRRTYPHLLSDMKEITHVSFVADFATGEISGIGSGVAGGGDPWAKGWASAFGPLGAGASFVPPTTPALCMRYSNDGGHTWSRYRQKRLISSGEYRSMMRYRGLGMARDRVFELLWSFPGPSALQGAYVEPLLHGS